MERIIIIGVTATGKTTLGKNIAQKLNIPAIDLDELHWLPNWQIRELGELKKLVDDATNYNQWVISGNYGKIQPVFWHKADTLIWLDYPFITIFKQLLKRSINRIIDKESICNGNIETWSKFLSNDSIILWLFRSFNRRKRQAKEIFSSPDKHSHLKLIRFKNPTETKNWLETIKKTES